MRHRFVGRISARTGSFEHDHIRAASRAAHRSASPTRECDARKDLSWMPAAHLKRPEVAQVTTPRHRRWMRRLASICTALAIVSIAPVARAEARLRCAEDSCWGPSSVRDAKAAIATAEAELARGNSKRATYAIGEMFTDVDDVDSELDLVAAVGALRSGIVNRSRSEPRQDDPPRVRGETRRRTPADALQRKPPARSIFRRAGHPGGTSEARSRCLADAHQPRGAQPPAHRARLGGTRPGTAPRRRDERCHESECALRVCGGEPGRLRVGTPVRSLKEPPVPARAYT